MKLEENKFNWTEYVYISQELSRLPLTGQPSDTARLRAAISRAYYAAFCNAKKYLDSLPHDNISYNINGESSHDSVINCFFSDSKNQDKQNIGLLLRNLKRLRKEADYNDKFIKNLSNKAETAIEEAETIINSLEKLCKSP